MEPNPSLFPRTPASESEISHQTLHREPSSNAIPSNRSFHLLEMANAPAVATDAPDEILQGQPKKVNETRNYKNYKKTILDTVVFIDLHANPQWR